MPLPPDAADVVVRLIRRKHEPDKHSSARSLDYWFWLRRLARLHTLVGCGEAARPLVASWLLCIAPKLTDTEN
jgi:hypothetical protein